MLKKRTAPMVSVTPSASDRRSPLDNESLSEGEALLLGDTAGLLARSAVPFPAGFLSCRAFSKVSGGSAPR